MSAIARALILKCAPQRIEARSIRERARARGACRAGSLLRA
jgi:hypothetical protein